MTSLSTYISTHKETLRQKASGAGWIIAIQLIVLAGGYRYISTYYDDVTLSDSQEVTYTDHDISLSDTTLAYNTGYLSGLTTKSTLYRGKYGTIYTGLINKKEIAIEKLDIRFIRRDVRLAYLLQTNIIDYPTYKYLQKLTGDTLWQTLQDLNFLARHMSGSVTDIWTQDTRSTTLIQTLQSNVLSGNHTANANILLTLQSNIHTLVQTKKSQTGTGIVFKLPWASDEKFLYIYNQTQELEKKYADTLSVADSRLGVDTNLMKALIMTEQLRAFYTFRGLAKQVMKSNYLTVMSKMSFGITAIKLQTAQEMEERIQTNDKAIYDELFIYTNTANKNSQRQTRLQSTNYHYPLLYQAGILHRYTQYRGSAGHPIKDRIGILATLYNIGITHSLPHANPQVGGAIITIGDEKYSFGELTMLLYYWYRIYHV